MYKTFEYIISLTVTNITIVALLKKNAVESLVY